MKAVKGNHTVVVILKFLNGSSGESESAREGGGRHPKGELAILKSLQMFQSGRNHVIQLHDIIKSHYCTIIVMPWESPLSNFLSACPNLVELLGTQFLEGVSFLHEHHLAHLDLKPENLLISTTDSSPLPRLSTINFGLSMYVDDEHYPVHGYRGTPSWTAPEVSSECSTAQTYSMIMADRWSCGLVLQYITHFHPLRRSLKFEHVCEKLLVLEPHHRPPLSKVLECIQEGSFSEMCGNDRNGFQDLAHNLSSGWCVIFSLLVHLFSGQIQGE